MQTVPIPVKSQVRTAQRYHEKPEAKTGAPTRKGNVAKQNIVCSFVACKVHKNLSSTFLLGATIVLIVFRLVDYTFRLANPRFSTQYPYWNRVEVDA